jgi:F0F1-type ATP synthase membrane subunit c/vacuolar-type H+-ATPase subunit K
MVQFFAETAAVAEPLFNKNFMLAVAFGAAALGLGLVGSNYMKALGRNPEAGKAAGQVVIVAAMIEVTALLAFLLGAFLLK